MINFLFRSSKPRRRVTALELSNERLRTLEIEEEDGVVERVQGEVLRGFSQDEIPFSVERIAKAVLESVEQGEFVVATHPEISPILLVGARVALEGKNIRVTKAKEREITARALEEARREALALEASRTGLRETDLVVVAEQIQELFIDGYSVERIEGFSGEEVTCTIACCVINRSLFGTLRALLGALGERKIPVRAGFEGFVYAERAARARKSGVVVFLGYALTRLMVFREGRIVASLPVAWGVRELFKPFNEVFGMNERTAKELLCRYEKGLVSEALRQKTRELILSHLAQFATLFKEAIVNVPSGAELAVELVGECAGLSEFQERLKVRKIHVLTPKNARVPKNARIASDSSFTLLSMSALNAQHKILDLTVKKEMSAATPVAPLGMTGEGDASLWRRVATILSLGLIAGLLTGAMLWHFVFPSAVVTVTPRTRSIAANVSFAADQNRLLLSVEDRAIPARLLREEKEAVRVFPATGQREKEAYAEGVIRVFNTQAAKSQILVAGTRFIAANGKLFKTTARVTVPPGSMDVRVRAAESGESYNIEPTTFSIPGLAGTSLYTTVYGKSSQPMTGGAKTTVAVVTESDIANAQLLLKDNLAKQAKETIGTLVDDGYVWLPEFTATSVLESKPLVKAGVELSQFNISSNVRVTALIFRRQDAEAVLKNTLSGLLSAEERLEDSSVTVGLEGERFRENAGTGDIEGTAEGIAVRLVDVDDLVSRLKGSAKTEAEILLKNHDALLSAQMRVAPFWKRSMPLDPSRIEIVLRLP